LRKKLLPNQVPALTAGCSLIFCLPAITAHADANNTAPITPPGTTSIPFDAGLFRPDPSYADKPYDPNAQVSIYGDKYAVVPTRPALELGRELFTAGPFSPSQNYLGDKNPVYQHLWAYGDVRTAAGYNSSDVKDTFGQAAFRLDLDVDYQFTATERIHAFFRPGEGNGDITRFDFGQQNGKVDRGHTRFDGTPLALFFEGDAARIVQGLSGQNNRADIPFAVGLMPLVIQNGIWLQSAFTGVAVTVPARNSPLFRISNMDVTFFAGLDQVHALDQAKTVDSVSNHDADIFGFAAFIEANHGYWEADYGYSLPTRDFSGSGLGYNNISLAFTRRYWDLVSNSMRVIYNVGQSPSNGGPKTANGALFLMENSLVSPLEATLVPYCDLFLGVGEPQSLARDAGAGGVLLNTGICFESDALTGFGDLDDTGHNTYGGALGVEYLFNLNQQIILEAATVQILKDEFASGEQTAKGAQYAIGARYQIPLTKSWIFRTDGILAKRENTSDLAGVRVELRYKF
jgi:hypothetical protein